jgi:hypothetical protein
MEGKPWAKDRAVAGDGSPAPTASTLHTNGMAGEVTWDVTSDVLDGATTWILYRDSGSGNVHYYSKEDPDAIQNPSLAPRLVLEFHNREPLGLRERRLRLNARDAENSQRSKAPLCLERLSSRCSLV